MKKNFILIIFTLLIGCSTTSSLNQSSQINFINISDLISINEFENIKNFVLNEGNRKTYRNFDNNNPHYPFKSFDVYLGADIGQSNMNNDPEISNFNELVVNSFKDGFIQYYHLIIVRKGDVKARKAWVDENMKEQQIYLIDFYDRPLKRMKGNLFPYLEEMKNFIAKKLAYTLTPTFSSKLFFRPTKSKPESTKLLGMM